MTGHQIGLTKAFDDFLNVLNTCKKIGLENSDNKFKDLEMCKKLYDRSDIFKSIIDSMIMGYKI